jgi:multiple sugar transport system substrate-binding protein
MEKMRGNASRAGKLRRFAVVLLAMTMLGSLLAACSKSGGDSGAERSVLRIGTLYGSPQDEVWFRQQYTDTFEMLNTDIDIEIVSAIDWNSQRFSTPEEQQKQPDAYEELTKMLNGQNPVDVVVVEYNYLRRLVQDNMLQQLDPLIQKDEFDLSDYVPTVLEGIKSAGDNNLYALTPTFSSSAMYYNKKAFTDAGVEFPTDGLFWEDIFTLAGRVAKGEGAERMYGISMNRWSGDGFYEIQNYSAPLQLKMYDDKAEKMLVNTPQWEKVWTDIANLYKNKVAPNMNEMQQELYKEGQPYNPYQGDLFMSGRVAMVVAEYGYMNELQQAKDNADKIEGFTPIDWDVVTVPQHATAPDIGGNVYLSSLMGINAKAQNPEDAWEYVKFLNSKDWAKLKSRSMWELTARKEFLKPKDGMTYNIDAFTKLKPIPPQSTDQEQLYRDYPNLWQVQNIGQPLFQEVMQGNKTVKEALAEWETQGNAMLQQIKENPNGPIGPIEGGAIPFDVYNAG